MPFTPPDFEFGVAYEVGTRWWRRTARFYECTTGTRRRAATCRRRRSGRRWTRTARGGGDHVHGAVDGAAVVARTVVTARNATTYDDATHDRRGAGGEAGGRTGRSRWRPAPTASTGSRRGRQGAGGRQRMRFAPSSAWWTPQRRCCSVGSRCRRRRCGCRDRHERGPVDERDRLLMGRVGAVLDDVAVGGGGRTRVRRCIWGSLGVVGRGRFSVWCRRRTGRGRV